MTLPTNVQASDPGHITHTNALHEAYNDRTQRDRNIIWVDEQYGSDTNSGRSLEMAVASYQKALNDLASHGDEIRVMPGVYDFPSTVTSGLRGVRTVGYGGISRQDFSLGVRFRATGSGMTMIHWTLGGSGNVLAQGPGFEHIKFVDNTGSPTSPGSNTLLHMDGVNRWHFVRCEFKVADIGLRVDHSTADNAWGVIEGGCEFYKSRRGIDGFTNGFRDFGSTYTGHTEYSIAQGGQHMMLYGAMIDGAPIRLASVSTQHHIIGCKLENMRRTALPEDLTGPFIEAEGDRHQIIGNGFTAGQGQALGVDLVADQTALIGNSYTNMAQFYDNTGTQNLIMEAQDL